MHSDFALRPVPPMLDPMALEPMEMTMWEASPPSGLRCVPLFDAHPGPMRISSRWPWPLSSRTARHFRPSASRVKLTPVRSPLLLPPSAAAASLAKPASCELELPPEPVVRRAEGAEAAPVDEPATMGPAVVLPGSAAVVPAVDPDVCGAAVCGAELSLFATDDVLTELVGAVVGVVVVLLVSVVTVA